MTGAALEKLRDAGSEAVDQLQRTAKPAIKEGKRQASRLVDETGELLDSAQSRLTDAASDISSGLIAYTKKNPVTALALAAAAGAVLFGASRIWHSRR